MQGGTEESPRPTVDNPGDSADADADADAPHIDQYFDSRSPDDLRMFQEQPRISVLRPARKPRSSRSL